MPRCEGQRKYGSFMTFGPRKWVQCDKDGIVMIKLIQDGKEQTLPACAECWQDCLDNKLDIIEVTPIVKKAKNVLSDE